jgi:hypothetical protein
VSKKNPSAKSFRNPVADEAVAHVNAELSAEEMRARARRRAAFEEESAERAARIRAAVRVPKQREAE